MSVCLLLGCNKSQDSGQTYVLQGAWMLQHAEYPTGKTQDYSIEHGTACLIYEGDSILYECMMSVTPSGFIFMPVAKNFVMLINKGGGKWLYLENDDPHPLTVNDSIVTIQRNGILYSWVRADEIYEEWGSDICEIIARDIEDEVAYNEKRYVLSAKERRQEKTIHWYGYFSAFIILLILVAAHWAIINRRDKRQLQLQLQQLQEVRENRPQAVRQVVATVENKFFASDEYVALKRRMASGQLMKAEEWLSVEQHLKTVYPGFISQLRSLYLMSDLEYHTCLLIKLRIAPKDIAAVLAREMSTISTDRSRLYNKVFGRKGGVKEWDDFILSIGT